MRRRPPLLPPLLPRGTLLRRVGLEVVVLGGTFAIFFATGSKWPWFVVLAASLAYGQAATRLYKWKWDDWPERTRREHFRTAALQVPVIIGFVLVFWFTPGAFLVKLAACSVYGAVVIGALLIARRVTTWEWLD